MFMNFEKQAEIACSKLLNNTHFNNTRFNVMGLSQGGLIARYIAETCNTRFYVNNMLTIGGPNMGVDKLPHCFNGAICELINLGIDGIVYFDIVQNDFGPAGYFRDPNDLSTYNRKSVFLPALGNEIDHIYFNRNKERFINLNAIMLVEFTNDTMIHPKETAIFGSDDGKGNLI